MAVLQNGGELVDAALVASALEIRREEGGNAGLGHFDADQARADRNGVRVIMLSGKGRGQWLGDLRAAASGVAVGGNGDADSGAADRDPALGARLIGVEMAKACVTAFLSTDFEGGRHQRRVDQLSAILQDSN